MDEEFGVNNLIHQEKQQQKQKVYFQTNDLFQISILSFYFS